MLIWINGTFGVGKTTTSKLVAEQTGWRLFDPEHVGYLLAANLRDLTFDDFQDLAPWRTLVPKVINEIKGFTDASVMVAVQTVLVEDYWAELGDGFRQFELPVHHVVLDCDEGELRRRIETDEIEAQALDWRLDHIARFEAAGPWLTEAADIVIDTTNLTPAEVAKAVVGSVSLR